MLSNHPDRALWALRGAYIEADVRSTKAHEAESENRTPETTAANDEARAALFAARRAFLRCPARTVEGAMRKLEDYCIDPDRRVEFLHELETEKGIVADEAVVSAVIRDLQAIVQAGTGNPKSTSYLDGPDPLIALGERWRAALVVRDEALSAQGEAEKGFGFNSEQAEAAVERVKDADRACIDIECEIATTSATTRAGIDVKRDVVRHWVKGGGMPPNKVAEAFGVESVNEALVELMFVLGREAAQIGQRLDPDPEGLDDDLGGLVTEWQAHRLQVDDPKWRPDPKGDPTPEYHEKLSELEEAIIAADAHTVRGLAFKAELVAYLIDLLGTGGIDDRAALELARQARKLVGGAS